MAQERGRRNSGNTRSVTELTHEDIRGRAARELLENKTLNQALDDLKKSSFDLIAASSYDEKQKREDLYSFIKTIDKFKSQLEIYVNKGKGAGIKLEAIING